MDDFYREEILDHYRSSAHRGRLEGADASSEGDNPLCGDQVSIDLNFTDDGSIEEVRFTGGGCAISLATASMLCEHATGKNPDEVRRWDRQEVLKLLGISLTPVRLKCALLPLKVLQAAIGDFLARRPQGLAVCNKKPDRL